MMVVLMNIHFIENTYGLGHVMIFSGGLMYVLGFFHGFFWGFDGIFVEWMSGIMDVFMVA